jgi:porphobilinogen synthase
MSTPACISLFDFMQKRIYIGFMCNLRTENTLYPILHRPRRNRYTAAIRSLVEETHLRPKDLIAPFFIISGERKKQPISKLPGVSRLSLDLILKEAEILHKKGVQAIALFPVIENHLKDEKGSYALDYEGLAPTAIRALKKEIPSLCVIADVALDPFTSHGHDGITDSYEYILNDKTVEILTQMALVLAQSGVDIVAPSDMMDGRIKAIRNKLDAENYSRVGILSYTAKYASSLYAPFRDAVGSTLKFGDKKTYQLNPANTREALRESALDMEEGADMLLVKPALFYLDILSKIKEKSMLPVFAYHVSGEYAMVMAAHEKGYLDSQSVFLEALLSIKRAGADGIISYATSQIIDHLNR